MFFISTDAVDYTYVHNTRKYLIIINIFELFCKIYFQKFLSENIFVIYT